MSSLVDSFPIKIKILRTTYHLSLAELAGMLSMKDASLYAWENGTNSPIFENVITFSNIFGVSLEWLAGRLELIYTEASVEATEKAVFEQIDDDFIAGKEVGEIYRIQFLSELEQLSGALTRGIPKHIYSDVSLRSKYYSLSVRANIAVLLYLVPLEDLFWAEEYVANEGNKRGVLAKVKSKLERKQLGNLVENYKEPGKKAKERAVKLVELLQPSYKFDSNALGVFKVLTKTCPIYDVEATYKEAIDQL